MALVVYDRVQETTTTTGTGAITLAGAVAGYQSFAVVGNLGQTYYCIVNGTQWEVGLGVYQTAGPTLSRVSILSTSTGSPTAINLSGASTVFITYPAEKSVFVDDSDIVTLPGSLRLNGIITTGGYPLVGSIVGGSGASGNSFWPTQTGDGSEVNSLYDGKVTINVGTTGSISKTSTFDINGNLQVNSVNQALSVTTSTGGTTVLTLADTHFQILIGTTTHTFELPDATTVPVGSSYIFDNDSTGNLFVVNAASGAIDTVPPGGYTTVFLEQAGTVAGIWGRFGMLPNEVNWGTNSLDLASTVISGGTWQGGTIASGYGGTGLTTFSAANNALYSTSSSALAAGTLPIAAGGTAATTFTSNGVIYGNGTSALGVTAAGTTGQVLIGNTGSAPSWGSLSSSAVSSFSAGTTGFTPSSATTGAVTLAGTLGTANGGTNLTSFTSGGAVYATSTSVLTTGTLPIASGGTGQTTASAAFNALSPVTTTGDLIIGNGTNSSTRLGIGANSYVLTSNGTTASWQAASGGLTITSTTTNANYNLGFQSASSGTTTVDYINTSFTANPSTGVLTAPVVNASNGLVVNSNTVAASYSIPSGSGAMSVGPMTVASGQTVTVPSGSRWVVL